MAHQMLKYIADITKFRRILSIKNKHIKDFFDVDGCGLEIEFGVEYSHRCSVYIQTGLKKLKDCVGSDGKFVTDNSVGSDFNVEIVLNPLSKECLKEKLSRIKAILDYYENFVFNEHCGVHANFRADETLKKKLYAALLNGGYKPEMFTHSKYKVDFLSIAKRADGTFLTYEEFLHHQNTVSAKYTAVNFLKPKLLEFRALDLNWEAIEYIIDLYEEIKNNDSLNWV